MSNQFISLGLRPEILKALTQISYLEMTPIQEKALPALLLGEDLIGQAMTGSGKTAAFGLALLQGVDPSLKIPQSLVLCPTRELAEQVANEIRRLAQCLANIRILTLCGGRSNWDQNNALRGGCHIVVGTPGRIAKHIRQSTLELEGLRHLVLDEADRMLDMGFMDEVEDIVEQCPSSRQTLLFSATFPEEIEALTTRVQKDPIMVSVESQVKAELLHQMVYICASHKRKTMVGKILTTHRPQTALVFCETRQECRDLCLYLSEQGAVALALHGELEQRDRDDVLLQFSNGSASILVATNLAARGLDIPKLPFVLISELSPQIENHLHRIGRTGRAGHKGLAVSIVCGAKEEERLQQIEDLMGQAIPKAVYPECETDLHFMKPLNRTLLILSGRKDKLRKGDVVGSLVKDAGIPPEALGRIDLMTKACAIAIEVSYAQKALTHLRTKKVKNKKVRVQLL